MVLHFYLTRWILLLLGLRTIQTWRSRVVIGVRQEHNNDTQAVFFLMAGSATFLAQMIVLVIMVGSLFPLHHQLVEATTYTIGDPEYLRIFTKQYHQVWTEILSQGGYLVRSCQRISQQFSVPCHNRCFLASSGQLKWIARRNPTRTCWQTTLGRMTEQSQSS